MKYSLRLSSHKVLGAAASREVAKARRSHDCRFGQVLACLRPPKQSATVQDTSQTPQITPVKSEQEVQWERVDEAVRKNLPPGVKLVRTLRGHTGVIGRIAWSPDGQILACIYLQ